MRKVQMLVFCVAAAVLSVRGDEVDDNINEMLKGTTGMLRKYDENLDNAVPFKDLKESMKILETMTQTYNGSSREAIYKACDLGRKASNDYFRSTDRIFGWCVKADKLIDNIINPSKTYSAKIKYKILLRVLESGMTAIDASYTILETVRDDMSTMSTFLQPVPVDLRNELETLKREIQGGRRRRGIGDWFTDTFNKFVNAIKTVVKAIVPVISTVLKYLKLMPAFLGLGVPQDVIDGKRDGTVDENINIVTTYYTKLIDAVIQVQGNVTRVQNALNKEITHVSELRAKVEADLDILNITEVLFEIDDLNELKKVLNEFILRHNPDSDSHNRRRRGVLAHHGLDSAYHGLDFASYGLDFDRISHAVDVYLNATLEQREAQFWTIPKLNVNPGIMSNVLYKL